MSPRRARVDGKPADRPFFRSRSPRYGFRRRKLLNIGQKRDCLLGYLVELHGQLDEVPLTVAFSLDPDEVEEAKSRCKIRSSNDLGAFIRSLEDRGLVQSHCSGDNTILGCAITLDGHEYVEQLTHKEG